MVNDSIIDGLNKAYEMMQGRVPRRYHPALHDAIHEIERLRELVDMLAHDLTCPLPPCPLCGEGLRAWDEARRG